MVESNQPKGPNPILKHNEDQAKKGNDGVHFDEDELTAYDKTRGQKMKIDDPKTPYCEDDSGEDHDMTLEADEQVDEIVAAHLYTAQTNKALNAKTT